MPYSLAGFFRSRALVRCTPGPRGVFTWQCGLWRSGIVHGIVMSGRAQADSDPLDVSAQSFHLKSARTRLYAGALEGKLKSA